MIITINMPCLPILGSASSATVVGCSEFPVRKESNSMAVQADKPCTTLHDGPAVDSIELVAGDD